MYEIVNSIRTPHLIPEFRQLLESEWGNVAPFESSHDGIKFPPPVLALEQHDLVGGLSFTCHAEPNSERTGVWINTVYVVPEYRNSGIATALIEAALHEAQAMDIEELFVFTEFPKLYERFGWDIVKSVDDCTVLRKLLPG